MQTWHGARGKGTVADRRKGSRPVRYSCYRPPGLWHPLLIQSMIGLIWSSVK